MRYRFIDEHRDQWPTTVQCAVLAVSRSGYYAWRSRGPSVTAQRRAALTEQIRRVHQASRQTYGSPRIHAELLAQGQTCHRQTVAKCMKAAGIRAKSPRRFRTTTTDSNHAHPVAANLVNRNFQPSRRNETWTTDIRTSPRTKAGCTWRPSKICSRARSWAGRCRIGSTAGWSSTPWSWPSPGSAPVRTSPRIRIGACSTPASTINNC